MANLTCLYCGHSQRVYSKQVQYRRCSSCQSQDLMDRTMINNIVSRCAEFMGPSMLTSMEFLTIMEEVISQLGIRLRPLSTVRLCIYINKLLEKKWKSRMKSDISIAGDGKRGI